MRQSTETGTRIRRLGGGCRFVGLRWLMGCALGAFVSFTGGCSRDHIDIELRDPDWLTKVNLEKSIQTYETERLQRPGDPDVLRKLGKAYEEKEDWVRMASVYREATLLRPSDAHHHLKLGFAHFMLALSGVPLRWERAEESLRTCISKDPNLADCHFYLGAATEHQDRLQSALEHYTRALRAEPDDAKSFEALAGLYYALHHFDDALVVATEGIRRLVRTESTAAPLVTLYTIQARIAWFRNDERSHLAALASAVQLSEGAQPALFFEMALAYLRTRSARSIPPSALSQLAEPDQLPESAAKALGARWFERFSMRCCRGKARGRFEDLCRAAEGEIIKLHAEGIWGAPTTPVPTRNSSAAKSLKSL